MGTRAPATVNCLGGQPRISCQAQEPAVNVRFTLTHQAVCTPVGSNHQDLANDDSAVVVRLQPRQRHPPITGIALPHLTTTVVIDVLPIISVVQLKAVASQMRIPVQALLHLVLAPVDLGTVAVKL